MTDQKIGRPAEGGYWYDRHGNQVYELRGANGKMRAPTLRDARQLGLLPGVSSILRGAAAPGLERWKQQQVLLAALTLTRQEGETEDAWLDRILDDSKQQAIKAAERGKRIHAVIQNHYQGAAPTEDYWPYVKGVADEVGSFFGQPEWKAEGAFVSRLGYGGKIDLTAPGIVLDFKTKEFKLDARSRVDKELAWDDHLIQLCGYAIGLYGEDSKARLANVFVSVTQPGLVYVKEWTPDEIARGKNMFLCLLAYWKAKSRYQSAW